MGVMFTNLVNYGAPPCRVSLIFRYPKLLFFLVKLRFSVGKSHAEIAPSSDPRFVDEFRTFRRRSQASKLKRLHGYPLVMTNSSLLKMVIEIVDLLIKTIYIFYGTCNIL